MLRKITLAVCFISIAAILVGYTGCWNLGIPTTVDSTANVGLYSSMKVSSVPSWILPYSVSSGNRSYCSLAVDNSGAVHVSYNDNTNDVLYYVIYSGSWSLTSVGPGLGLYSAIAVDSSNNPYIASYTGVGNSADLVFSYKTGGSIWVTDTVDDTGNVGSRTSLAVEADGTPHVSYRYVDNSWLKYATKIGNTWQLEVVDTTAAVNQITSIALDNGNNPHIAYYDDNSKTLKYASKSGGWNIETVDPTPFTGRFVNLIIDSQNIPNVVYGDYSTNIVKFARKISSSWTIETVDITTKGMNGTDGTRMGLALINNNTPAIVYQDAANQDIKYAEKSGGSWKIENVESKGNIGAYLGVGLDTAGTRHIIYIDSSYPGLRYLAKAKNVYHISYYDTTNKQIKHATGLNGVWSYESVDTTNAQNANTAIALDNNGYPNIAYGNSADGSYHYATRTSGTWLTETITTTGYVSFGFGGAVALAIGNNNIPQVSYLDYTGPNYGLGYAVKSSSSWLAYLVDTTPSFGGNYNSIAVDQNNYPHISYLKDTTNNGGSDFPSYAHFNGIKWTIETVENRITSANGVFTSIAIDASGTPHISYIDNGDVNYNAVLYAVRQNGVWSVETVKTADTLEYLYTTSIAIDDFGVPHISYYNLNRDALNHAQLVQKAGRKWYIDNPTEDSAGGNYDSLAIQDGYIPAVSYYYGTGTSLNYNQRSPTFYTLPDIKVLYGQSIDSAFDLDDYSISSSTGWGFYPASYQFLSDPLVVRANIGAGNIASYSTTTIVGYAGDTVWYDYVEGNSALTYWSQFKQSDFLLKKLPRVISEGTTVIENPVIQLSNYLSQSTTYSGSTHWQFLTSPVDSEDTGKTTILTPPGSLIFQPFTAPLKDRVDITVTVATAANGTNWDKEIVRVYPVLNTHSSFTTPGDTTSWAYELPANVTVKPQVLWQPGLGGNGGSFGNMALNFTAANQGIKLTPLQSTWLKTEPNQWYTVRVLLRADTTTSVNNNVSVAVYAFNGVPPAASDIGAHVTLSATTVWTWYEVPIFSGGTSMYPQLQIKNTSTASARIQINKWEIIKARPDTELVYGTPHVAASAEKWNVASDTTKWAFEQPSGVTGLASYSVNNGAFDVSFPGGSNRGLKMTSAVGAGVVKTYSLVPGKAGGMSMKVTTSGSLSSPVVLLAVFGTDSVNSSTIKELGAFANVFRITTNSQNVIRMAYPSTKPYGYEQIQLKNAGAAHFYLDDIYLEADNDLDNYWDNTLFP